MTWFPGKPRDGSAYGVAFGKSAPSPPPAPDPTVVSNAQSAANVNTAVAQAQLNDVNQVTPYGTSTFQQTGTTYTPSGDAIPQYTQTVKLNPTAQSAVDNQQALAASLSKYGLTLPSQLPTQALSFNDLPIQSQIDTSKVPGLSSPTDFSAEAKQAQDAAYQQGLGLIQPGLDYQKKQLESQMDNAGIPRDSAAWKEQEDLLATEQGGQINNLAQGAVATGNQQQATLANEALSNNQAGFNEAAAQQAGVNSAQAQEANQRQVTYDQAFNNLAALLQGAPAIGQPNVMQPSQSGVAPTDVTGAYGLQQAARNTAYQGGVASANAGNSATAGLAGAAITAAAIF